MDTDLRVLSESFQMSTNMIGFRWFTKIFASYNSSLSIERVKYSETAYKSWCIIYYEVIHNEIICRLNWYSDENIL